MTAQDGNGIVLSQAVCYFIPVIKSVINWIVIKENKRCVLWGGIQNTIHPDDRTARNMAVTHSYIRTRGATKKTDAAVIKNKFVVSKKTGESEPSAFAPSGVVIAGDNMIRYIK